MQTKDDQAIQMYRDGSSLRTIATTLQVDRRRIAKLVKAAGCSTRCGRQPLTGRPGTTVHYHGYIMLHRPDHPAANQRGYVREHRLVMEEHLGRYLTPDEVVHHRNEIVTDNRLENLELFANNAEHVAATFGQFWPDDLIRKWYCDDNLRIAHVCGLIGRAERPMRDRMESLGMVLEDRRHTGSEIEERHLRESASLEPKFRGYSKTSDRLYNVLPDHLKELWQELGLCPFDTAEERQLHRVSLYADSTPEPCAVQ